jgi:hypothetical protein
VPSGTGGIVNTGSLFFTWVGEQEIWVASLEPNTLEPRLLYSEVRGHYFFVSPYTGTIAWIDDNNIMHFQQSDGSEFLVQLDETWGRFRQWLSSDRVILGQFPTAIYGGYYPADDDFYILTPDTGQIEHYHFEMPEYFATAGVSGSLPHVPLYDSSFRWAIYATENYDSSYEGMILWDVQNAREIWRSDDFGWPSALGGADWRQDGNEVVITAPEVASHMPPELFSVTVDGIATQLTHLSESIPTDYMIFDTLWSPNGRYIAFVLNADLVQPLESRILYILDLERGIATNYCISPVNDLVWSPNSDQIAFTVDHRQLVILNIDSGSAQGIDDVITEVYGWIDWIIP